MADTDDLLLRLMLSDATFLTTKEKTLLQQNLAAPAQFAAMALSDICAIVNRTIKRAAWNGAESLKKAQGAQKIIAALGIQW